MINLASELPNHGHFTSLHICQIHRSDKATQKNSQNQGLTGISNPFREKLCQISIQQRLKNTFGTLLSQILCRIKSSIPIFKHCFCQENLATKTHELQLIIASTCREIISNAPLLTAAASEASSSNSTLVQIRHTNKSAPEDVASLVSLYP